MRFDDRVALVTGGAHGIGRATVERLHAEGAAVVIADHDAAGARSVAEQDVERLWAVDCDVTVTESVTAAVGGAVQHFGALDIVVTVAGGSRPHAAFSDLGDADWADLVDLNLTGTMRTIRAAEVHLLASSKSPAVVTVGSVNGLAGWGDEPYSAAKAGVFNLTRNLALRYGERGVRVNAVAPGTVHTRVWNDRPGALDAMKAFYPIGRVGEPEDIAAAIAFLASDDAAWITGITLPVDGGVSAGPYQAMRTLLRHVEPEAD